MIINILFFILLKNTQSQKVGKKNRKEVFIGFCKKSLDVTIKKATIKQLSFIVAN